MPAGSLIALLDDIASVLDDIAVLTKVATKKTAGVLGDDLALNAQQVSGVNADRELPVVWAVAKGSLVNKCILVPAALAISALLPWAVTPLLMIGGAYLCFEGVEKLAYKFFHSQAEEGAEAAQEQQLHAAVLDPTVDLVALEREKIRGAVRTDFVLSAEIVTIALGTVAGSPILTRLAVLVGISLVMTLGVYGLVAAIVKLDDLGLYLVKRGGGASAMVGRGLLRSAPWLMKGLSVAGTLAMFLVGGGILTHGVSVAQHAIEHAEQAVAGLGRAGELVAPLTATLLNAIAGVVAGTIVLLVVTAVKRVLRSSSQASA